MGFTKRSISTTCGVTTSNKSGHPTSNQIPPQTHNFSFCEDGQSPNSVIVWAKRDGHFYHFGKACHQDEIEKTKAELRQSGFRFFKIQKSPSKEVKLAQKQKSKKEKKEKAKTTQGKAYQDKAILVPMYEKQNMSAGMIATHFGVTRSVILYFLKKFGVDVSKTRRAKSPDAKEDYKNADWLVKQVQGGKSLFKISKECGVAYGTVHRFAEKLVPAKVIE